MEDLTSINIPVQPLRNLAANAKAVYHKQDPEGRHKKALLATAAAAAAIVVGGAGLMHAGPLHPSYAPSSRTLAGLIPIVGAAGGSMYAYRHRDDPAKASVGIGVAAGSLGATALLSGSRLQPGAQRLATMAALTGITTSPALAYYAGALSREATGDRHEYLDSPAGKKHPYFNVVDDQGVRDKTVRYTDSPLTMISDHLR